jgi:hypothetical protein
MIAMILRNDYMEDVVVFVSAADFRYDGRVRPHESYNYAKIIMKSGEVLYLTSLLYPDGIEDIIK